jgi:hypothetical protein
MRCADHATPSIRKSLHYFAKKRRSLSRHSSLADQSHEVFFIPPEFFPDLQRLPSLEPECLYSSREQYFNPGYKLWNSSLRTFLQYIEISSFLGWNIWNFWVCFMLLLMFCSAVRKRSSSIVAYRLKCHMSYIFSGVSACRHFKHYKRSQNCIMIYNQQHAGGYWMKRTIVHRTNHDW